MYSWHSLARKFRGKGKPLDAQLELVGAYQRVFRGNPSRQDQEAVLADLASQSRFYQVSSPDTPDSVLRHVEGGRALYGRIFSMLTLGADEVQALELAARHEAALAQEQHNN
jgi:hypothetical protein